MGQPKISIGMPLYNSERFLNQAFDSLLKQDYENIEIIISDNASTDRTANICSSYSESDKRIQYHRNDLNIGACENFNRVLSMATGEYYMWAAYDDLWEPSYISELITLLEIDPMNALAFALETRIDEDGNKKCSFDSLKLLFSGNENRVTRILKFIWFPNQEALASLFYGIYRTEIIQNAGGLQDFEKEYWGRDLHTLLRVLLSGRFVCNNKLLFSKRVMTVKQNIWPQMEAVLPLAQVLIKSHKLLFRKKQNDKSEDDLSSCPKVLLKLNELLKTFHRWREIYYGYLQIISNSDLTKHQKFLLKVLTYIKCLWKQMFEFYRFPRAIIRNRYKKTIIDR
jgi:glycosyltransferase involved in cell wall biosynthesis